MSQSSIFIPVDELKAKERSIQQDRNKMRENLLKGPYLYRKSHNTSSDEFKGNDMITVYIASGIISVMFISSFYAFIHLPIVWIMPIPLTLFILMSVSYYKAVTTKPGKCINFQPKCSEEEKQQAIERETFGKEHGFKIVDIGYPTRYCTYCKSFRSERSYHCKKCGCCVLRRDHHCPWIGQCVGLNNHRYFMQFLYYLPINGFTGMIIQIWYLVKQMQTGLGDPSPGNVFFIIFSLISAMIMFAMSCAVASLTYHYSYLLLKNMSSMEDIELVRYECLSHHKAPHFPSYDIGALKNWQSIMGTSFLSWTCPWYNENKELNQNSFTEISLSSIHID
ncbi:palmitoyltransferase PFA3, putative [Entamoeba histolytica HM-3:IMSS]|uniref:Palmitoyltransferase n=4 Tax=Entamoeba histolytica TaxID=5759 RepID=B1N5J3_ENTH1|nr:zinc finger protein, putative [Entamoeba histolytica HM-1:IMSS]EDS88765.1 zinc finger protein, putative [Entamoeba histolytica HM-1:IMSS]EMD43032.1 palmitoyltransferase PFA3, putative [Entamoeba histolytica KU27]EMS17959.1 palmitoyltransferase PFA3, putative [Entamoeba histolytica HM-3:IMSS]GAT99532.1 hypothetical protein conserved domain containing [Entamoeba histolytica]|eukprot:XP_001914459.1 zinc finger protein, putative [Entamoeba histolytica HM-1:IMSS]